MKINKNGFILQVTLVLFLFVSAKFLSYTNSVISQISQYYIINDTNELRLLELSIIGSYKDQVYLGYIDEFDYQDEQYHIYNEVIDKGTYFEVTTTISKDDNKYNFFISIDYESITVSNLSYDYIE